MEESLRYQKKEPQQLLPDSLRSWAKSPLVNGNKCGGQCLTQFSHGIKQSHRSAWLSSSQLQNTLCSFLSSHQSCKFMESTCGARQCFTPVLRTVQKTVEINMSKHYDMSFGGWIVCNFQYSDIFDYSVEAIWRFATVCCSQKTFFTPTSTIIIFLNPKPHSVSLLSCCLAEV